MLMHALQRPVPLHEPQVISLGQVKSSPSHVFRCGHLVLPNSSSAPQLGQKDSYSRTNLSRLKEVLGVEPRNLMTPSCFPPPQAASDVAARTTSTVPSLM